MTLCVVLFCPAEQDTSQSKDDDLEDDDCEWTITVQPHTDAVGVVVASPTHQALTVDLGQQAVSGLLSPSGSLQADNSTLSSSAPQVKLSMLLSH